MQAAQAGRRRLIRLLSADWVFAFRVFVPEPFPSLEDGHQVRPGRITVADGLLNPQVIAFERMRCPITAFTRSAVTLSKGKFSGSGRPYDTAAPSRDGRIPREAPS